MKIMCCSSHHDSDRPRSPKRPLFGMAIGIAASAIAIAATIGFLQTPETPDPLNYSAEEIARVKPFRAVHEMGMGAPIPFLPKTQPQPQIEIPETFYNFGSIGPTEVVQRTFALRNTGKETLTISRAYTTCGCTIAQFSASAIAPGQVALVTVTFDAGFHDSRGHTVKRGIIIENNDPNQPQAEIWIQASVREQ